MLQFGEPIYLLLDNAQNHGLLNFILLDTLDSGVGQPDLLENFLYLLCESIQVVGSVCFLSKCSRFC